MKHPIGVTAWSLPSPNTHSMDLAKALGFDAIQLDLGNADHCLTYTQPLFQRLAVEESRRLGLSILPMTLNALGGHGFVEGRNTADGRIAYDVLRMGLDAAAAMGLEGICVPSFGRNEIHTPAHFDATAEALRFACGIAGTMGLRVYTENVLPASELTRLFAAVDSEQLYLEFDCQNYSVFAGEDAAAVLRAFCHRIGSFIHVKDGVTDPGDRPIGAGRSPLAEIAAILREVGFAGTLVLENNYDAVPFVHPAHGNVFDAVQRDIAAVRGMMD